MAETIDEILVDGEDVDKPALREFLAGFDLLTPQPYGAIGDGSADDYAALAAADAAAVLAGKTLYIGAGTYKIGTSLTFSAAVYMNFGASFSAGSGKTVTFDSAFSASISPHFGSNITAAFGIAAVREVFCEWWGAVTYPTKAAANSGTDSTSAIDAALATGKNVRPMPGYYSTTGGHSLATVAQQFKGCGRGDGGLSTAAAATYFTKRSGTNPLFTLTQTDNFFGDVALDGNGLGGSLLALNAAKYCDVERVTFTGQGGSDYALNLYGSGSSRCNSSTFRHLAFVGTNFGLIQASRALYCNFYDIQSGPPNGGESIDLGGTEASVINFYNVQTEGRVRFRATATNCHIYGLGQEAITETQCVYSDGSQNCGIVGHYVNRGGPSGSPTPGVQPVYDINTASKNFTVQKARIRDTGSAAGYSMASIDGGCFGWSFEDIEIYSDNAFNFILCTGTRSDKGFLKQVNSHSGAAGANIFKCSGLTVINSNLAQTFLSGNTDFAGISISGNINTDNAGSVSLVNCPSVTDGGGLATGHQI